MIQSSIFDTELCIVEFFQLRPLSQQLRLTAPRQTHCSLLQQFSSHYYIWLIPLFIGSSLIYLPTTQHPRHIFFSPLQWIVCFIIRSGISDFAHCVLLPPSENCSHKTTLPAPSWTLFDLHCIWQPFLISCSLDYRYLLVLAKIQFASPSFSH